MIALAHDWLVSMRGGEWVLDRLASQYGPTDLYTLVKGDTPLTPAIDACSTFTSPLQYFPGGRSFFRRQYFPLMPWAVSKLKVKNCDLLISTSSAVIKGIEPPQDVPHLCYCHTPARYIWDQMDDYATGSGGLGRKIGLRLMRSSFQNWDRKTAQKVTQFIANSRHTAERIERIYKRKAQVIYPPIRTQIFKPDLQVKPQDFFLVVSALEPYKKIALVVEAANRLKIRLKVAGIGTQFRTLKKMSGPTVEILGHVSEEDLIDLYRQARALIFPQIEDFGITALESQSCGCPVIAFKGGGALETVTEETGIFFQQQTIESVIEAIQDFQKRDFNPMIARENAKRFGEERFDREIDEVVRSLL